MATRLKNLSELHPALKSGAKGMKFGVVVSDYHKDITHRLLGGCVHTLLKCGIQEKDIVISHVPGAFELPAGAQMLASSGKFNALICLGCVIKGETKHDEYINHAVATGIMQLTLLIEKPIAFGVLTTNNLKQAQERAGGKLGNKGAEAALSAVKMAVLKKKIRG